MLTVDVASASTWLQTEGSLNSAIAVKRLPTAEANRKIPLTLTGVVTCVPEGWKGFFLEDASGGIYCEPQNAEAEKSFWPVRVGEEVQLQGVTAPGHRNSFVAVTKILSRQNGILPRPTLRTIRNTIDDRVDADFVRVRGHIVGLVNIAGEMEYGLLADDVEALVVHSGFRIDPKVFDHAEVEVCGIVIPQEGNARPIKIIVPEATCFKMLATHLDVLSSTKASSIQDVLQQTLDSNPVVRISGNIFCNDADDTWLVENGYGIDWRPNETLLPEGTKHVELLGILKRDTTRQWVTYATVLSTSNVARELATSHARPVAQVNGHANELVTVNATFWDSNAFNSDKVLSFDLGNSKLTCRLLDNSATRTLPQLTRGAEYRVTGLLTPVAAGNLDAPELLLRSISDVVLVSGPPWPIRFTLYIVSMLSTGLALGLATTIYCWRQASTARRRLEITRNDLRIANESLEGRVAERTSQLDKTNRRLTDEANARLLVEKEQKETLACLEDAQSLAQIGSFVWQAASNSSLWSKQCYLIHGLDPQSRPPSLDEYCQQVSDDDRSAFRLYLQKATASSEREEFRYRITFPSDEIRWVRSLIKSFRSTDGSLISIEGIVQNVTDQVWAEEQLRHSVKMEVAGHLAGGIAHDLNNTLAIIKLNCYLLNAELHALSLDSKIADHVLAIETASDKSAMLTRQLLTFSRKQIIRPVRLNVNSTIQSFSSLLSQLLENRVKIEFHLAEHLPDVRLDQGQLEQILMNLILNARDAIAGTGTIRVRTSEITVARATNLSKWALQPKYGQHVSLSVVDDGAGIPPECLHKIFEPFYSTKGPEKGTGLGLAVVHGIVRQNHGGLCVESQPNQETSFQLLIPVASDADVGLASESTPVEASLAVELYKADHASRESILLVDDEPSVGKHTEHVLKHLGYSVTTFTSAQAALELVKAGTDDFQLLLTDYSMPHMSGLELAKQLRAILPDLPVILMSGFLNEEAFRSMPAGLDPLFIQKPFTIEELATSIRKAIQQFVVRPADNKHEDTRFTDSAAQLDKHHRPIATPRLPND